MFTSRQIHNNTGIGVGKSPKLHALELRMKKTVERIRKLKIRISTRQRKQASIIGKLRDADIAFKKIQSNIQRHRREKRFVCPTVSHATML